jgi:hypothetical protein
MRIRLNLESRIDRNATCIACEVGARRACRSSGNPTNATATGDGAGRNPAWAFLLMAILLIVGFAGGMLYQQRQRKAVSPP